MIENKRVLSPKQWPRRCLVSTWWLLAKTGGRQTALPTVNCGGEQVLPVFSGEGEAEMFVRPGSTSGRGWRVRETSGEQLISILYGSYAGVSSVALDPCPEMVGTGALGLVSVTRKRFVSWLTDNLCSSVRDRATFATNRGVAKPL